MKRMHWLAQQIKQRGYHTGAEVGCRTGATTGHILVRCPRLQLLYAVDLWDVVPEQFQTDYWKQTYPQDSKPFRRMEEKFNHTVGSNLRRVKKLVGLSWSMANRVADGSLDFVFIDADHAYESVRKDIMAWLPKVRQGGLMCGHDIDLPGVSRAVSELFEQFSVTNIDKVWYRYVS